MGRRRRSLLGSRNSPVSTTGTPAADRVATPAVASEPAEDAETVPLDEVALDPPEPGLAPPEDDDGDDAAAADDDLLLDDDGDPEEGTLQDLEDDDAGVIGGAVDLGDDETVPREFHGGDDDDDLELDGDAAGEQTEPDAGFGSAADFDTMPAYEPPADAPFAKDLFGDSGYDELPDEPPPTEEVPSGVMEDVSQPYNAPYSVPEPPPIPGILDRFTPPPAQRTELGSRRKDTDRPDYLDETPAPSSDRLHPPPSSKHGPVGDLDDDDDERRGPPLGLLILVGSAGLALLGLVGIVFTIAMFAGSGGSSEGVEPTRDPVDGGVEVRENMTQEPGLIGVEDPHAEDDEEGTDAAEDGTDAAEDGEEDTDAAEDGEEGTEEAPEAAPEPAPQPRPKARPRPRPKPEPKPVASTKGTLKIRSNRRVLVYVNGQAIGYTPQDYKVDPGDYSVSAMVPGQPNTKQTRDASIAESGATAPVDFTF